MVASSALIYFSLSLLFFFLFYMFSVITSPSLPLLLSIYASRCCPLLPSISPLVTWATLAVEIKVIKDLPWPPPVGQLNTSPPPVEELESPSQTAQPSPGQTTCDQHHQGGCWCSHCLASLPSINPLSIRLSMHSSIHPSILVSVHPSTSLTVVICLFNLINEQFA